MGGLYWPSGGIVKAMSDNQNSGGTVAQKHGGALKPFPKGVCPNPKGRPKGSKSITTYMREMLDAKVLTKDIDGKMVKLPMSQIIAMASLKKAATGCPKHLNTMLDRLEGAVVQKQKVEGDFSEFMAGILAKGDKIAKSK